MNRYTNRERSAVKSVVVDMNAQYIKFIKALFPNALDLIVKNHPQFEKVYDAYQDVFNALKEKNRERLIDVLENYRRSGQNISVLSKERHKNNVGYHASAFVYCIKIPPVHRIIQSQSTHGKF